MIDTGSNEKSKPSTSELHVDGNLDAPAAPVIIAGSSFLLLAAGRKFDMHIANTGRLIKKSLDGDMMMLDTITRNKRKIIGLLIIVVTVCVLVLLAASHNRRANARVSADRIIAGEEQATREQIHEIITHLVATKSWTRYGTRLDTLLVERLCEMRYEMWKSRLQTHSTKVREQADRIISGKEQATEEQITEIIYSLSFPSSWPQRLIAQDRRRLQQLQDMLNEMVKSRVQAYRAKVREQADRIISGKEQATREQINKIISTLSIPTAWPDEYPIENYRRRKRLCEMRNEMVTPHN